MSKGKVRLYQIARDLDVDTKALIDLLQEAGQNVKNHMSTLDGPTQKLATDLALGKVRASEVAVAEPPAAPEPAPVPAPKTARPASIPAPRGDRPQTLEPAKAAAQDKPAAPTPAAAAQAPAAEEKAQPKAEPVAEKPAAKVEEKKAEAAPAVEKPAAKTEPAAEEKPAKKKTVKKKTTKTKKAAAEEKKAAEEKPAAPEKQVAEKKAVAEEKKPAAEAKPAAKPKVVEPAPEKVAAAATLDSEARPQREAREAAAVQEPVVSATASIPKPGDQGVRNLNAIPKPGAAKPRTLSAGSGGSGGGSGGGGAAAPQRGERLPPRRPMGGGRGLPPRQPLGGVGALRGRPGGARPAGPRPQQPVQKPGEGPAQKPIIKFNQDKNQVPGAGAAPAGPAPAGDKEKGGGRGRRGMMGRDERRRDREQRAEEQNVPGTRRGRRMRQKPPKQENTGPIILETPVTVRSFSEAAGVRANEVQRLLMMELKVMATINATMDQEQAELVGMELGREVQIKTTKDVEDVFAEELAGAEDAPEDLVPRPPVVTFMGHVDHGKTSLMDRIRKASVASGEAGGITQHVGAYKVHTDAIGDVTFLDTPGHAAFTEMRSRGANVTDIVVLVVAADDGVMPQTEEAISHAKAAKVPIIVALNKIDLPGLNKDKVFQELSQHGLQPEEWGGDTQVVGTSAETGAGIDDLLEAMHLVAELNELKANPDRAASGTCVESSLSEGRGVTSTLLVINGTLKTGDVVLCGEAFGKVRAMFDDQNKPVKQAGPSTPVVLSGLDVVPAAGERFVVLDDIGRAREIAETRKNRNREQANAARGGVHSSLESLFEAVQTMEVKELKVIVKADVRGSLQALAKEVGKFEHDEVKVNLIHQGVGAVGESDVLLADASDAIIVAFNVVPEPKAEVLARAKDVEIRRYSIIYKVADDIRDALEGMLEPERKEVQLGRAVVQQTFSISRFGTIAGCRVVQGTVERGAKTRIIRDGTIIGTYALESLKRHKEDAKSVREGLECGIKLANFNDIKQDDMLEAYKVEEIKRKLED